MSLPPRGPEGGAPARLCGRQLDVADDGEEILCREPGTVHILWELTPEGWEQGWACEKHRAEALSRWTPVAWHLIGHDCDMPGSRYYADENVCRVDDLPECEEPVNRELAVA